MDKIKFAMLVCYISAQTGQRFNQDELEYLAKLVEPQQQDHPQDYRQDYPLNRAILQELMVAVVNHRKIEAIKAYRAITGLSLKESKDAVEDAGV